jgi:uncharacterized OB-fold protein
MAKPKALYDQPMWDRIAARDMALQRCRACGTFRYPPGPSCPACLAAEHDWTSLSGKGEIVSWAVFHRKYLADYPPPYNVIAVRLAEGPMMISNLEGPTPMGSWIGAAVELVYVEVGERVLPRFRLA